MQKITYIYLLFCVCNYVKAQSNKTVILTETGQGKTKQEALYNVLKGTSYYTGGIGSSVFIATSQKDTLKTCQASHQYGISSYEILLEKQIKNVYEISVKVTLFETGFWIVHEIFLDERYGSEKTPLLFKDEKEAFNYTKYLADQ